MSEYDIDGDGYADHAITVDDGDSTATVVDVDGDGYADVVVYEPAEYQEPGEESAGDYPAEEYGTGADVGATSSSYYNDYTGTGVSSDGDTGYVSLGDGEFYAFGDGM
jgi:hypothetical protein